MHFSINRLLPPDLQCEGSGDLVVPPWAFQPDAWSFAFLRGLRREATALNWKRCWEIGVGTGLNLMLLAQWCPRSVFYFSDLNPDCTPLARRNIGDQLDGRGRPLEGQWDLVSRLDRANDPPRVDAVIACIPQVPTALDLSLDDNLAHYYRPEHYREAHLHALGLGLNETLLRRARSVLAPGGQVILNLGGRPGVARLVAMFQECGYRCRTVHEEVIPQHRETSLSTLAGLEAGGQEDFEFFADASATMRINARAAEPRRLASQPVFHKIYVVAGSAA